MAVKLDKKDISLLSQLAYSPRTTDKRLSTLAVLSKDSVRYRIKRLEKMGVITGYSCFIDQTKFGYQTYKLYIKAALPIKVKEEFVEALSLHPQIFAFAESKGNWDFAICFLCKTHNEFSNLQGQFLGKINSFIRDTRFCSLFDVTVCTKAILETSIDSFPTFHLWDEPDVVELSDLDKEILKELFLHSRQSYISLAQSVSSHVETCKSHIKILEEKGIIKSYITRIDYSKLGFIHYKILISLKSISDNLEQQVFTFLKGESCVANYSKAIGSWQYEVELFVKDHQTLETMLSKLQELIAESLIDLEYSLYSNETMYPAQKLVGIDELS
jgi:DNA-binding Lrp family transcriptional regulator